MSHSLGHIERVEPLARAALLRVSGVVANLESAKVLAARGLPADAADILDLCEHGIDDVESMIRRLKTEVTNAGALAAENPEAPRRPAVGLVVHQGGRK